MELNKVAIIGMGPSGITAAIYLKRSGITPICFEQNDIGGKLNILKEIENYPGYIGDGKGLSEKFIEQIKHFDIDVKKEAVQSINKNPDNTFTIKTDAGSYLFQAVIIATGIREKPFKVPGSEAYFENGISRCAECDANFHKNRPVAVIGNSQEAIKDTIYLASICSPVYLINSTSEYKANQEEVEKLKALNNVTIYNPYKIVGSSGQRLISKLVIENVETKEQKTLDVEGLFIFLGATPMTEFLGYMDILDEKGNIAVDEHMKTRVDGLFAIGDIRNAVLRQVITAVSDGGVAAVSARNYLNSLKK